MVSCLWVFLVGLFCFFSFNYYYLVVFVSLEVMVLSVLLVVFFFNVVFFSPSLYFFFLVVGVCMGGYGISLLVSSSREEGLPFFLF